MVKSTSQKEVFYFILDKDMTEPINNLREARIKKLEKIREMGINPYPSLVKRTHSINKAQLLNGENVAVAGRVMSIRGHGKIIFATLTDESGKIQIVFKQDLVKEKTFKLIELVDIADFLVVQGKVGQTKTGEISIFVEDFQFLGKTILPLPSQWYGLKDVEERYRKRYLDMILNPQIKNRISDRSRIIQSIRDYLNERDFVEIETPTIQVVYGGGFAKPFVVHHNALDADFYLRISDEMFLKRLIVGGFEKVYEITKDFRNEGIDQDHNPEFTMFEAMIAYEDYFYGMDLIEELVENAAIKIFKTTKFFYSGNELDFKRPWPRLKMVEAIKNYVGVDPLQWKTVDEAKKAAHDLIRDHKKLNELKTVQSIGEVIAFIFEELVEEKLIQPTIIYDFPVEVSPLAKKSENPKFTQRFEAFASGFEISNNYTELNDPLDLFQRFVQEKKREEAGFEEAQQTDYDYITAIEHGFPPTCGIALGVDRLAMLLTGGTNIKEVIAFPLLRPETNIITTAKQDFGQKLVIVIDPTLPNWQIMNTSAHAAAFLGNKMETSFDMGKYFTTKDGVNHPRNTQYGIVTKSAIKKELKELMEKVRDSGLLYIGYLPEMMEASDDKKLQKMIEKKTDREIEYAGIGIFGPKDQVDKLTKKFPLWK